MTDAKATCELCGEPMPLGEEMFKFHGYSGPCPKPPIKAAMTGAKDVSVMIGGVTYKRTGGQWVSNREGHVLSELLDHVATLTQQRDDARRDAELLAKWRERRCVLVPVSGELLSHEWSVEPMHVRIIDNGDGSHELQCRHLDDDRDANTGAGDAE